MVGAGWDKGADGAASAKNPSLDRDDRESQLMEPALVCLIVLRSAGLEQH